MATLLLIIGAIVVISIVGLALVIIAGEIAWRIRVHNLRKHVGKNQLKETNLWK